MDKNPLIAKLNKAVPGAVLESRRFGRSGIASIWLEAESITKTAEFLSSDADLKMDWLENLSLVEFEEALVATYFVTSSVTGKSLILRISAVPASVMERVYFLSTRAVWPMIEPMEREAEELFGVTFGKSSKENLDTPDTLLKSNLLPEGWTGFPLRKGYIFPEEVYGLAHSLTGKIRKKMFQNEE